MIDHSWSVVCSQIIIDHETKNASLINIIEEITLQRETPFITIPLTIATTWRREPEDAPTKGQGRIFLLMPQQDVSKQISIYEIDLLKALLLRAHGTIPGLPFQGPGTYRFVIQLQDEGEVEWKEVASIPLRVRMQTDKKITLPEAGKDASL